jgi:hypothetical protein
MLRQKFSCDEAVDESATERSQESHILTLQHPECPYRVFTKRMNEPCGDTGRREVTYLEVIAEQAKGLAFLAAHLPRNLPQLGQEVP